MNSKYVGRECTSLEAQIRFFQKCFKETGNEKYIAKANGLCKRWKGVSLDGNRTSDRGNLGHSAIY